MIDLVVTVEHLEAELVRLTIIHDKDTCKFLLTRLDRYVCTVNVTENEYFIPSVAMCKDEECAVSMYKNMLYNYCTNVDCNKAYVRLDHHKDSPVATKCALRSLLENAYGSYLPIELNYKDRIKDVLNKIESRISAEYVQELLPEQELVDNSMLESAVKEAVNQIQEENYGDVCEWNDYGQPGRWDTDCGHVYFPYVESVYQPKQEDDDVCPWCGRNIEYNEEEDEYEE